ncbi:MAG: hypothetical protein JNJ58_01505 [Chitinophagaceae bacterium]|nr:hypothetical protein [Chitinophagaceae bacterium]
MKKNILLLVALISLAQFGMSQINNQLLNAEIDVHDSLKGSVLLSVENKNFLRNNEYFGNIATGYTLFGTQLALQTAYVPHENVRIQGGIFLLSDFGNPALRQVSPMLTLKLQKKGYSFLFGTLEGNLSHRLIEPLFNYERYISHPIENGLQFKINHDKLWSDTWLNWEVMQYYQSDFQEQFTAGHSTSIQLFGNDHMSLHLPLQGIITHRGGQIDTLQAPLQTMANGAIGLVFSYRSQGFIRELKTENYYSMYKDLSPVKQNPYNQGDGIYLNVSVKSRQDVLLSAGYWQGKTFMASRGGYLFQSAASIFGKPGYQESNREILFFRLLYQHKLLKGLSADVRFEPYYDLGNQLFEYNYSIFLTYKKDFEMINLIKRKGRN